MTGRPQTDAQSADLEVSVGVQQLGSQRLAPLQDDLRVGLAKLRDLLARDLAAAQHGLVGARPRGHERIPAIAHASGRQAPRRSGDHDRLAHTRISVWVACQFGRRYDRVVDDPDDVFNPAMAKMSSLSLSSSRRSDRAVAVLVRHGLSCASNWPRRYARQRGSASGRGRTFRSPSPRRMALSRPLGHARGRGSPGMNDLVHRCESSGR